MYIDDHRWFSKHVPSVPSTFIMNYVPDPAAPAAPALQQLQQDVREELAEICQEHEMDSTTKGTWVEFCSGDSCALVPGRLGSLIYMIL